MTGITVSAVVGLFVAGAMFYWNSVKPDRKLAQTTASTLHVPDEVPQADIEEPSSNPEEEPGESKKQQEPGGSLPTTKSDESVSIAPEPNLKDKIISTISQAANNSNTSDDALFEDEISESPQESAGSEHQEVTDTQSKEPEPESAEELPIEQPVLNASQLMRQAHNKMSAIGRAFRKLEQQQLPMVQAIAADPANAGTKLSWRVHLLPEMGLENLYDSFHLDEPWDSEHNKKLIDRMPDVYNLQCSKGHTRFRIFRGKDLFVRTNVDSYGKDALDGGHCTALAFFVGPEHEIVWTKPDSTEMSLRQPRKSLGISYREPTCILLVNGNTLRLERGIHPQKLLALAAARGGEKVERETWFADSRQATLPPPKSRQPNARPGASEKPPTAQFVDIPSVRAPKLARNSDQLERYRLDPIKAQMRKITLAMLNYADRHRSFPVPRKTQYVDAQGKPLLSWRVHILPYLDQQVLYKRFNLDEPWDSPHNQELAKYIPDTYKTGKDPAPLTRFQVLSGEHLPYSETRSPTFRTTTDGTANTILFVQTGRDKAVPWTKPDNLDLDLKKPKKSLGKIRGSLYCAMMDGNVLQLPAKVPDELLAALATPRGGEVIDLGTVKRFARHAARLPLSTVDKSPEHVVLKLKQLSLAMLNYQDRRKSLPMNIFHEQADGELMPMLSWRVALLPYIEQGNLHKQFKKDEPWDSPHNRKLIAYMPDLFRDADDSVNENTTRIVTLTGPNTPFLNAPKTKRSQGFPYRGITDGTSNTILMIQTIPENAVPWTKPVDLPFDPYHPELSVGRFSPRHGLVAAFADGAVHIVPPSIELSKLKALVTPRGGELIGSWR